MSDSFKVVVIIYVGFMLSLLVANILWGIVQRYIDHRQQPKAS